MWGLGWSEEMDCEGAGGYMEGGGCVVVVVCDEGDE